MRTSLPIWLLSPALLLPLHGQSEAALKQYFEGKRITVKIDMPATKDGIDVYPREPRPINFDEYSARIKQHGVSVRTGESIMITKVRVKDRILELQLGGGGYGTFWDDTNTGVVVPAAGKTRREKNLEDAIKTETDPKAKRKLQEELDDLRQDRRREDARNQVIAAQAEEAKREQIRAKAREAGSRFNLRFPKGFLLEAATPELVMDSLREWVDFGELRSSARAAQGNGWMAPAAQAPAGALPGEIRKGMDENAVQALLGTPLRATEKLENGFKNRTAVYVTKDSEIEADFVDGILVRYRISSR